MKIKKFNQFVNESVLTPNDIEDVADAIASYLNGDDFPLEVHGTRRGTGWDAIEDIGFWDVIDYNLGWGRIKDDYLDIDVDDEEEIANFVDEHYDEIINYLKKNYPEARNRNIEW